MVNAKFGKAFIFMYQEWKDNLMQWNPDECGGVQSIRLPLNRIFQPDILLYNM